MISVSGHVWESMGYSKLEEGESLHSRFYRLLVYHVEGFATDLPIVGPLNHVLDGQSFVLAIGKSVNNVSRALADEELVEDEDEWRKGNATIGPYLVLKIGPTNEYATTATHVRKVGNEIWTNGGFEEAGKELDKLQNRTASIIISSLTAAFSSNQTAFRSIEAVNYGIARSGERVRDMRFSMSAYAIVSQPIAADEVGAMMLEALTRSSRLDRKVAGFYDLALKETDPTKQFLLFFIALELLTKTEFAARYPVIAQSASGAVLPANERKTLEHQFSWLQRHALMSLSLPCVASFQRLRQRRNLISHGAVVTADVQDVIEAKALAATIIAAVMGFPAPQ
ncbi:hypothetical protein RMR10_025210 (plasmid) [Agrobacterium rosae]|uniref:hypothetical protein n=1 Tax=Agrobacterium rosae TaxID=1972867 RepID=UPI002A130F38|nr:hypothetical protein [Agrobacterium rosae]MDX8316108.1 hypothetical protein [Agrobacterium rosae]